MTSDSRPRSRQATDAADCLSAVGVLVHGLLPRLLEAVDRGGFASVLRAHEPLPTHTASTSSVDYVTQSLIGVLRATRTELAKDFQTEWMRTTEAGVPRSLQELGGARKVREDFLPGLNRAIEAVSETSDTGKLARSCVELAINIAITRNDNARGRACAVVPAGVIAAYQTTVAEFAGGAGAGRIDRSAA